MYHDSVPLVVQLTHTPPSQVHGCSELLTRRKLIIYAVRRVNTCSNEECHVGKIGDKRAVSGLASSPGPGRGT